MWALLVLFGSFLVLPPSWGHWGAAESRSALILSLALLGAAKVLLPSLPFAAREAHRRPSLWTGLLLVYLVSIWWATKHGAVQGMTTLLLLAASLLALLAFGFSEKVIDRAIWTALALQAGLVLWQSHALDPLAAVVGKSNVEVWDNRCLEVVGGKCVESGFYRQYSASGSLGNTGLTAAWVALALPSATLSRFLPAWARMGALAAGLFLVLKMGSLLAFLAVLSAALAYLVWRGRVSKYAAFILCALFLFLFALLTFQHGETAQRRAQVWKGSVWWMQRSHWSAWVIGRGLGSFEDLEIKEPGKFDGGGDQNDPIVRPVRWAQAHNEVIQMWVETGIIGALLLAALVWAVLCAGARAGDRGVTVASATALGVVALGLFPFREPTLAILALSVLARSLHWEKQNERA